MQPDRYTAHRWSLGDLLLLPGGRLHIIGTTLIDGTAPNTSILTQLIRLAHDWGIWRADWDPFLSYAVGDDKMKWSIIGLEGISSFAEYDQLLLDTLLAAVSDYLPPGVIAALTPYYTITTAA